MLLCRLRFEDNEFLAAVNTRLADFAITVKNSCSSGYLTLDATVLATQGIFTTATF
jgi:hypothetical protein